jgi:cell division protein FtsB
MDSDAIHITAIGVQTLIFLAGAYGMVLRANIGAKTVTKKVEQMEQKIEALAAVVTKQAVQDVRLTEQSRRMTMLEERVEDLRNGRGYVQDKSIRGVDREY